MKDKKYDISYTVAENDSFKTVRGAIKNRKGVSTRLIRQIKAGRGEIYLNGKAARFSEPVSLGDHIGLVFAKEEPGVSPADIALKILYETEDLIIIDKEPYMVVHPTKGHTSGTVANALAYRMQQTGEIYKPRFISRLDMNTSGVLVVGKNSYAQSSFIEQVRAGKVSKVYRAIVHGKVLKNSFTIDLPIGKKDDDSPGREVRSDGYSSQTEVRLLENFGNLSFVELRLLTGRTHQIRVHMAHIGHPVVGDSLYAPDYIKEDELLIGRQALHSYKLAFSDIRSGEKVEIVSDLPVDMRRLAEDYGLHTDAFLSAD